MSNNCLIVSLAIPEREKMIEKYRDKKSIILNDLWVPQKISILKNSEITEDRFFPYDRQLSSVKHSKNVRQKKKQIRAIAIQKIIDNLSYLNDLPKIQVEDFYSSVLLMMIRDCEFLQLKIIMTVETMFGLKTADLTKKTFDIKNQINCSEYYYRRNVKKKDRSEWRLYQDVYSTATKWNIKN